MAETIGKVPIKKILAPYLSLMIMAEIIGKVWGS
jgi:hypothetical protein